MTDRTNDELKQELSILYSIVENVHSIDLDELLSQIVTQISDMTKGDSVLIYTLDGNNKELILQASKNPHEKLLKKITMKLGEGITGWVAKHKQSVVISEHASDDKRFKYFSDLPEDKYEAFVSIPILFKKLTIGVINVQHKKKKNYSNREVELLSAIGKLIGGAVKNALLIEETLELRETLEMRKIIERAKGILMKQKKISENDAYQLLRNASMKDRVSIKDVAEAIILTEKIL